ncbi:MAG: hypothetical protein L3J52_08895, partial [Proteobacteria bacterium]|nr:hypothetical protein [Pseudomonadota bacterium]
MFFIIVSIAIGVFFRFDQFFSQILVDDEWHAVHQLLYSTPIKIFSSFGLADHSIPLTLFFWLEAEIFGLSESLMRWPMMLSGLIVLILFPIYVYKRSNLETAAVFAFLLAISPMLVYYSRLARPYMITLLLIYLSHWLFVKYLNTERKLLTAFLYVICSTMAIWMHLVVGLIVIAPFIWYGVKAIYQQQKATIIKLLMLGIPTAIAVSALIIPPLMLSPKSLTNKMGVHSVDFETVSLVWFNWIGTSSTAVLLFCLLLMILGIKTVWSRFEIARSVLFGIILTTVILVIMKTSWIHIPTTFGRYLISIIPIILLSIAFGSIYLSQQMKKIYVLRKLSKAPIILLVILLLIYSPIRSLVQYPNSNTLHSFYKFSYKQDQNTIAQVFEEIPLSKFWNFFENSDPGEYKIAAAPWFFQSYSWDALRWQQKSRQQIFPAYFSGCCVDKRKGEIPFGDRIKLKNMVYLSQIDNSNEYDFIVYQKPYTINFSGKSTKIGY